MQTNIEPVSVFPHTATKLVIAAVQVRQLGEGGQAFAAWQLFTADDKQVQSGGVEINGSEYTAWGEDDTYILNLVVSKLGLTAVP
jgi:hypothetical protein